MVRSFSLLALATTLVAVDASAQTLPAIQGPVYVATYVEFLPTAIGGGAALLKQYRDASRNDTGNQRMELVQELGRPTRFALVSIWADQTAYDGHGRAAHTARLRDQLRAVHAAPYDERVHGGMAVGARNELRAGAVIVLTHVDVPGTFKDATVPLLHQLAEASRKEAGCLRFEAQQQGNRQNHFTLVEHWADAKAYEGHVMADHTRQFRDKLGPMVGALYDERLYKALD